MDKIILMLVLLSFVASCATAPSQFCDVSRPYIFSDPMEVSTTPAPVKRFIVGHNKKGAKLCGWTSPK